MNHPARPLPSMALKGLALATLLAMQVQAIAATPSSDELKSVKLYGDVTIAQDSLASWGPWEQFEAPAAAPSALTLPRASAELYRTLPRLANAGAPSISQNLIGFGVFSVLDSTSEGASPDWHPLTLTGTAYGVPAAGSLSAEAIQTQTTAPSGGTYLVPDSGKMVRAGEEYSSIDAQGRIANLRWIPEESIDSEQTQSKFYQRFVITDYIAGEDGLPNVIQRGSYEMGVMGVATSEAEMAALRAQGLQATYTGVALSPQGAKSNMVMGVNFKTATFNADFAYAGGFSVNGTVSGASFASTNSGPAWAAGSFTGNNAAGVMGHSGTTVEGIASSAAFIAARGALTPAPVLQTPSGVK